jgi:hypothetical protein
MALPGADHWMRQRPQFVDDLSIFANVAEPVLMSANRPRLSERGIVGEDQSRA